VTGHFGQLDHARSALFALDAGCPRSEWVALGMSFKAAGGDLDTWLDWCATGANFGGEREARSVWRSFRAGGGINAGTLFHAARDTGWTDADASTRPLPVRKQTRPAEPARAMRETLDPRWLAYWQSIGPVRDAGRAYLEARQCVIPPADSDLRFDPAARHPGGYTGPCITALVTDALSGAAISLHRTWVSADGTKAGIDRPRMLLGSHRKAGGVIRLWSNESVTTGLGIAEGIETALSLAHAYQPVWACIDAGNLKRFPVLLGVESLTIAVDNDPDGIASANECAGRWAREDRDVALVEVHDGA
jgi:putative DNA primase/helicase